MLPTFIIVGAAKSGTTSVHNYLQHHPEVCMSLFKEPLFFTNTVKSIHTGNTGTYSKGLEWYKSLFNPCKTAKAIGDVSPIYMEAEDSPRLIKQIVPDVKLIFIFRDPIKRLYSHYWNDRKIGQSYGNLENLVRERHPRFKFYLSVSSYDYHLKRYLDVFPEEQISVFLYEELRDNPRQFMQELYRTIGVEPEFVPPNLESKYNVASLPRMAWLQRLIIYLSTKWVPTHPWLYALRRMPGRLLVGLNSKSIQYPPMEAELHKILLEELSETIDYVEQYLNRPLPAWR